MQQKQYQLEQIDSPILAIAPIQTDENNLYILSQNGCLYRYDVLQQQLFTIFNNITLPILNTRELRHYGTPIYDIKCSANGKFVAIYVDYGQFGIILDIEKQRTILEIDTQNYYEDTVPFSLAFTTFEHDDIVIYRSDWNRLESFNLSQNISTTARYIAPYERNHRPEHYLDYFHGALYVSPNDEYILDDGWVWQPYAVPHLWSLPTWLMQNPFESEDGASLQAVIFDEEDWDYPMCWLDNQRFALWHTQRDRYEHMPDQHESMTCLHLRICQILANKSLQTSIWQMPEQRQKLFHIYADQDKILIIGNENISLYDLNHQQLIAQIPNNFRQKQHIKRQSLWAFQHTQLIEIYYGNMDSSDA